MSSAPSAPLPLQGAALAIAATLLAFGNLMAVLDITIANVSIPNLAGGLAVSPSEATWIITSYGVAEAVTVPLTGWLARSFGQVRTFCFAMAAFGVCSLLCGLTHSFGLLVFFRVLQGMTGAPMIPLSQTLLLSIFPKDKAVVAGTIWTLGASVGPIFGPLLGGVLCDQYSWEWIFLINVPFALGCSVAAWLLLRDREKPIAVQHIDVVGLALLVLWAGSFQVMLDRGRELAWFGSPFIVGCLVIAVVGFISWIVWELTEGQPIVDLTVFKSRGYTTLLLTYCLGYGAFFANIVLSPLWMQTTMDYTATQAAIAICPQGIVIIFLSKFIQKLMLRFDKRILICAGVMILAAVYGWRSFFARDVTFQMIFLTHVAMGFGMAFLILPIFSTVLGNLPPSQIPAGAGMMSFVRTMSVAFSASVVTTVWDNSATVARTGLLQGFDHVRSLGEGVAAGLTPEQALYASDRAVQAESVMLATNHTYLWLAVLEIAAALFVWFSPKPKVGAPPGKP